MRVEQAASGSGLTQAQDADFGTVIDVRKLSLTFATGDGPVFALEDIDLAVRGGEFISFIGPSG